MLKLRSVPKEGDLVVCTVKRIEESAVFVDLDEYENVEGIIRIDEVAAGRIRSLYDYVQIGKKIVCKVLKSSPESRTVYLSLRRVSEGLRRAKLDEYKKNQTAFKILEAFLSKKGENTEKYRKYIEKILDEYGSLYYFFQEAVVKGENVLKKLGIRSNKERKELYEYLKQKVPPKVYTLEGDLLIQTLRSDGIKIIKEFLIKLSKKGIKFHYVSAPNYKFRIESLDPKDLNKKYQMLKTELEKLSNEKEIYYEIEEK